MELWFPPEMVTKAVFAIAAIVHAIAMRQVLKVMLSIFRRLDALNDILMRLACSSGTDEISLTDRAAPGGTEKRRTE